MLTHKLQWLSRWSYGERFSHKYILQVSRICTDFTGTRNKCLNKYNVVPEYICHLLFNMEENIQITVKIQGLGWKLMEFALFGVEGLSVKLIGIWIKILLWNISSHIHFRGVSKLVQIAAEFFVFPALYWLQKEFCLGTWHPHYFLQSKSCSRCRKLHKSGL